MGGASQLLAAVGSGMLAAVSTLTSIQVRSTDERRDLVVGLSASLAAHVIGLGSWLLMATVLLRLNSSLVEELQAAREDAQRRLEARQVPTIFVEVTPAQMSAETPEDTPYYSTANSQASNPDPADAKDQPKIDGRQQEVARTLEVLQPAPELLQPAPPPDLVPPLERLPAPDLTDPADLAVVPDEPRRPKPRTLVQARMERGLVGPQMRLEGGAARRGVIALDAKASPFGAYDAALIAAVQKRWYDLLDTSAMAPRSGRVVVRFTLHLDGRVTDVQVLEQEVGEIYSLYCRKAITDPAPYARWPREMQMLMGKDYRDIRFTFYYY